MTETRIPLPDPDIAGTAPLETAIAQRRSTRSFAAQELTLEQIGQLLWAAQGITGGESIRRAAPSAGGCHPLTFYLCRADGMWRYHPEDHALTRHREQDVRRNLTKAAWNQPFIAQAPCVFVIAVDFERTAERYGGRGRTRYVPMDIGHAAQNVLLQAVALGLASVPVGSFDDAAVKALLALPDPEEPLYILPVGYAR